MSGRTAAATLLIITAALVVISLIGDAVVLGGDDPGELVGKVVRMFDLDEENNVPTYFSTALILAAATILAVIGRLASRNGEPGSRQWWLLAVVFLGLSFDEFASLHEILIEPVRDRAGGVRIFYFGWVVPGLVFVAVVGALFLPFLMRLPDATRRRFIVAGTVYVVGALGVELIEGYIASGRGEQNWPYIIALTAQEAMEMIGMIMFITALIQHLAQRTPHLRLELTG